MKILIGLTYYRPHYSGLTIYTERLARTLAARGHEVTVLTSRFHRDLPNEEVKDGVRVVRKNVSFRLSKGVIMLGMPVEARRLIAQTDVVNLHVPQMDAAYQALMARSLGKPVVLTYHCDMRLPKGFIHRLANIGSNLANRISLNAANNIVTNTLDFAEHSEQLREYLSKVDPVLPPVELPAISDEELTAFKQQHAIRPDEKIIGINARLASEKGVEFLVNAMPLVHERYPTARVLYAGQYQHVLGEEEYASRLAPLIQTMGDRWKFLGVVSPTEQVAFFKSCHLTVLPSINSTESYGMVQVESMYCGTPVVATDLPGVRHAVRTTGMGKIVPPRDAKALADAILDVLKHPEEYKGDIIAIRRRYAADTIAAAYENIFETLVAHR